MQILPFKPIKMATLLLIPDDRKDDVILGLAQLSDEGKLHAVFGDLKSPERGQHFEWKDRSGVDGRSLAQTYSDTSGCSGHCVRRHVLECFRVR